MAARTFAGSTTCWLCSGCPWREIFAFAVYVATTLTAVLTSRATEPGLVTAASASVREIEGDIAAGKLERAKRRGEYTLDLLSKNSKLPLDEKRLIQAEIMSRLGYIARQQSDFRLARSHHEQTLQLRQAVYTRERHPLGHLEIIEALKELASTHHAAAEYDAAKSYLRRALRMNWRLPGGNVPRRSRMEASCRSQLGSLLLAEGRYSAAREQLERAKTNWMAADIAPTSSKHAANQAMTYCLLSRALRALNALEPAQEELRAASVLLAAFPREAEVRIISLCESARTYQTQGDFSQAEEAYSAAIELGRKFFNDKDYPHGHASLASTYNAYGQFLSNVQRFDEARDFLDRALRIRRDLYTPEAYPQGHPEIATSLNNIGTHLLRAGKLQEAEVYLQDALEMRERIYGTRAHANLASSLSNIATLRVQQGRFDDAVAYMQRALRLCEALYPPSQYPTGHHDLERNLRSLAQIYLQRRNVVRAQEYFEQALAMARAMRPSSSAIEAENLVGLARVSVARSEHAKGAAFAERAFELQADAFPEAKFPAGLSQLAETLILRGTIAFHRGKYADARGHFEMALAYGRQLHPHDRAIRKGHGDIARTLNNLGAVYNAEGNHEKSAEYFRQALQIWQALFPVDESSPGHPLLVAGLSNVGSSLQARGRLEQARPYFERAAEIAERIYLNDHYPHGHPSLGLASNNLMTLLDAQGEVSAARVTAERMLNQWEEFYSPERYPDGHRNLAYAYNATAHLLYLEGQHQEAFQYALRALKMRRCLYPRSESPRGHKEIVSDLRVIGDIQLAQERFSEALQTFRDALAMSERLFPEAEYPGGHTAIVNSLASLGDAMLLAGEVERAGVPLERQFAMQQQLYPADTYPLGHPELTWSRYLLARWHHARGDTEAAVGHLVAVAEMERRLAANFYAAVSEIEAFNYARKLHRPDLLLSVQPGSSLSDDALYGVLQPYRGLAMRLIAGRHAVARAAADDELQQLQQEHAAVRQRIAQLALAPAASDPDAANTRHTRLQELSKEKERLERRLALELPASQRSMLASEQWSHDMLTRRLPEDAAVIDFVHYRHIAARPASRDQWTGTEQYTAFLLLPNQAVRRIQLGSAAEIHEAIDRWRQDIEQQRESSAGARLRRLLWSVLEEQLPEKIHTLYLCSDQKLHRVAWAALPGAAPGTVLLERFAITTVPDVRFLEKQLAAQQAASEDEPPRGTSDRLLIVADVAYDASSEAAPSGTLSRSLAARGDQPLTWTPLPGTAQELTWLRELVAERFGMQSLVGEQATTTRLVDELPRARWAHIATHGFFADPETRSAFQLDEQLFGRGTPDRSTVGGRNPLVLSGLVLAGANRPRPTDDLGLPLGDGGIVTAESIAALNLSNLHLAVLSACETGRGDIGTEGAHGLQRAFHLAGARNVISSLWKVDDQATAALMKLFYHHLWEEGKSPRAALRDAQLALYYQPELIGRMAKMRAPDFTKEAGRVSTAHAGRQRAPARLWAAFQLSGAGLQK